MLTLVDYSVSGFPLLFVGLLELISLNYIYGKPINHRDPHYSCWFCSTPRIPYNLYILCRLQEICIEYRADVGKEAELFLEGLLDGSVTSRYFGDNILQLHLLQVA